MGRKGNYADRPKKGPGRKMKKQGDPAFSKEQLGTFLYLLLFYV